MQRWGGTIQGQRQQPIKAEHHETADLHKGVVERPHEEAVEIRKRVTEAPPHHHHHKVPEVHHKETAEVPKSTEHQALKGEIADILKGELANVAPPHSTLMY